MNNQHPEHRIVSSPDLKIDVQEIFLTIQGEGPFAGQRAVFIRLAGCNLQCPLCDTDYTSNRQRLTVGEILSQVQTLLKSSNGKPLVVITGGEPFRQPLHRLTFFLITAGYKIQIETNGTIYQELPFDHITVICSPKTGIVNRLLQPHIAAYKYVGKSSNLSEKDGLPLTALDHPVRTQLFRPDPDCRIPIYLQPADEKDQLKNLDNQKEIVQSCLTHGYRLCLQIHKIIGVE